MPIKIKGTTVIDDDRRLILSSGTTAQRPALPTVGMMRYNTDLERLEEYNGVNWISVGDPAPGRIAYGWGVNSGFRISVLGDNTTIDRSSPVTVVGSITNWKQISAGNTQTVAVTNAGVAYAWGKNNFGQLGTGNTTYQSSPVTVIGGITNWSQVATGTFDSVAVTRTGVVYAWGINSYGQAGDNTTTRRSSPVTVVGGITNWSQVSLGNGHTAALTDAGVLYAWGRNTYGQLGTNNRTFRSSPVTVVGAITNWSQVSAGLGNATVAITDSGVAYAWGFNASFGSGQIGDNSTIHRSSPVTVAGGITNWSQISSGGGSSAGITETGIAYTWGANSNGQLGTGNRTNRSSPVTVAGGITNWSQIAAGALHTAAITDTGVAYAWGANSNGQLGTGNRTNRSSPVTMIGGITDWTHITAGQSHTMAIALDV